MKLHYSCAAIALLAFAAANPALSQDNKQLTEQQVKCETAFTKIDADDNGLISKEEADEAIDRSFEQLDFDNDGRVTRAEYNACHEYSEIYANSQNGFAWLQKADTNQDKTVTKEEMAAAGERQYQSDPDGMTKEEHARQMTWDFNKLDENNNGTIDFSEWRGTPVAEDVLPGDGNGDQALDSDEWRTRMQEGRAEAEKVKQTTASESNSDNESDPSVWLHYLYIY